MKPLGASLLLPFATHFPALCTLQLSAFVHAHTLLPIHSTCTLPSARVSVPPAVKTSATKLFQNLLRFSGLQVSGSERMCVCVCVLCLSVHGAPPFHLSRITPTTTHTNVSHCSLTSTSLFLSRSSTTSHCRPRHTLYTIQLHTALAMYVHSVAIKRGDRITQGV
jgi:hypothetical protein